VPDFVVTHNTAPVHKAPKMVRTFLVDRCENITVSVSGGSYACGRIEISRFGDERAEANRSHGIDTRNDRSAALC
jgi:hypothetical protein